jgi:hypothetical protein
MQQQNSTYNSTLPIGKLILVPRGESRTLWAYNGDTSGSITFTVAFRNARYLGALALSAIAACLVVLSF